MRVLSVLADGAVVSDIAAARGFYTHHLGPSDEESNLDLSPNTRGKRFGSLLSRLAAATELHQMGRRWRGPHAADECRVPSHSGASAELTRCGGWVWG